MAVSNEDTMDDKGTIQTTTSHMKWKRKKTKKKERKGICVRAF